ncbi:hypothetical protein [Ignatzschineria indica]|uniref:hypothetical protein n=1 Tax=Ignatzschineria indica TaxID=472583 RepID=UPI00130063E6|nr:hypothetical protein [Ignatzschineria indica]
MSCRISPSRSFKNYAPADWLSPVAGKLATSIIRSFSASSMPTCGHAVEIRAK